MNIGLLWLCDDKKASFSDNVIKATNYYKQKYGKEAKTVFVNPSMDRGTPPTDTIGGIIIRVNRAILPSHLWIGEEE